MVTGKRSTPRVGYFWVDETCKVKMPHKPSRVQTVLPAAGGLLPNQPIVQYPVHMGNVFFEDEMHDWRWSKGTLRYFSRVSPGNTWIRCEFDA